MLPAVFTEPFKWDYLAYAVLIFFARILDVSAHTVRIILLSKGKRKLPTIISFFEVLLWIMVITHLVKHIAHWTGYVAYAAGFATGTYLGTLIEPKSIAAFFKKVCKFSLARTAQLSLPAGKGAADQAYAFLQAQGLAWSVPATVISKSSMAINETLETINACSLADDDVHVALTYDELSLDVEFSYKGRPMCFPETRPSEEEILLGSEGLMILSGYIIRNTTKSVIDCSCGGVCRYRLHFGST